MYTNKSKLDILLLILLIVILAGLPVGIRYYDRWVASKNIPPEARVFTLSGHAERGWLLGEVPAYDAITFWKMHGQPVEKPVVEVSKGDRVIFKLKSSDVVHGFSLKDFDVFLTDGIQPGKAVYISFVADKAGVFTFSCNAVCGDIHQNMQGTLIVKA